MEQTLRYVHGPLRNSFLSVGYPSLETDAVYVHKCFDSYLYWEGKSDVKYDFSKGYVISGKDTAEFLEIKLAELRLNRKEANEFIVYWLPRMQENTYNLITFQNEIYTNSAKLDILPKPDNVLRVFMAYEALDEKIEMEEPDIEPFERTGFTVVEWGGTEIR